MVMLLPLSTSTFVATPSQNLLCTQRPFGNYWAFAVFSGPDFIANLSDGLKIMDPSFESVGTYHIYTIANNKRQYRQARDQKFCLGLHLRLYCECAKSIEISSTIQYI